MKQEVSVVEIQLDDMTVDGSAMVCHWLRRRTHDDDDDDDDDDVKDHWKSTGDDILDNTNHAHYCRYCHQDESRHDLS